MTFPDAEECRRINGEAKFGTGSMRDGVEVPPSDRSPGVAIYPSVGVAGVQVFVYLCHRRGVLRISAHFDEALEGILDGHGAVPVEVDLGGTIVWRSGRPR